MTHITHVGPVDTEAELDRLAQRYRSASGPALRILNLAGSRAESMIDRLPAVIRDNLVDATEVALRLSMRAASESRSTVPDQKAWVNTAMASALGAAGGF
ncbi:unnamed protein product, partial [Ectocarpus sp. 12 AP-2014]